MPFAGQSFGTVVSQERGQCIVSRQGERDIALEPGALEPALNAAMIGIEGALKQLSSKALARRCVHGRAATFNPIDIDSISKNLPRSQELTFRYRKHAICGRIRCEFVEDQRQRNRETR